MPHSDGGAAKSPHGNFASIDALRGIAIALVLVAHLGGEYLTIRLSIALGNAGVILFFFLSGFLIEKSLSRETLAIFATRRAAKILPMYWVSIGLAALAGSVAPSLFVLLANATLTAPLFGVERLQGVYWTLYIEAGFYVLAAFVVRRSMILPAIAAIIMGAVVIFAVTGAIGSGAFYYLAFCLCGSLASKWHKGGVPFAAAAGAIAAAGICALLLMPDGALVGVPAILCGGLFLFSVRVDWSSAVLASLGRISYSLYLLHSLIAVPIFASALPWPIKIAFALCVSVAAASASWWLIERQVVAMAKSQLALKARAI